MKITNLIGLFFLIASPAVTLAADANGIVTFQKKGAFADLKQDVTDEITKQGFVIDQVSHIGDMLARTAKDLGAQKSVYVNAEALQFCPAKLSRDMFESNPADIALCPQVLAVYEMASHPGTVYVAYRRLPKATSAAGRRAHAAMTKVLDDIARKVTH